MKYRKSLEILAFFFVPIFVLMLPDLRFGFLILWFLSLKVCVHSKIHWSNFWLQFGTRDLIAFLLLLIGLWFFQDPTQNWSDVLEKIQDLGWWFIVYPLFSALPQEVLYRLHFHELLEKNFKSPFIILISALNFSFLHIVYLNSKTLLLTFLSGMVLAWLYRSRSDFGKVVFWHSISGLSAFCFGLEKHFI